MYHQGIKLCLLVWYPHCLQMGGAPNVDLRRVGKDGKPRQDPTHYLPGPSIELQEREQEYEELQNALSEVFAWIRGMVRDCSSCGATN